jgi:tetratricopeptide (TPR) repeat protein
MKERMMGSESDGFPVIERLADGAPRSIVARIFESGRFPLLLWRRIDDEDSGFRAVPSTDAEGADDRYEIWGSSGGEWRITRDAGRLLPMVLALTIDDLQPALILPPGSGRPRVLRSRDGIADLPADKPVAVFQLSSVEGDDAARRSMNGNESDEKPLERLPSTSISRSPAVGPGSEESSAERDAADRDRGGEVQSPGGASSLNAGVVAAEDDASLTVDAPLIAAEGPTPVFAPNQQLIGEIQARLSATAGRVILDLMTETWNTRDTMTIARAWNVPEVIENLALLIRLFENAGGEQNRARPQLWILATLYHLRSDPGSELICMERAVTDSPQDVDAICALARCAAGAGYKEMAVTTLEKGVENNPRRVLELLDAKAQIHRRFQQYTSEVDVLQKLVRLTAEDQDAHVHAMFRVRLGVALAQVGRIREAEHTLSIAIDLDPSASKPYIHLAQVLERCNRAGEAEELLQRGAERAVSPVPLLQFLAAQQQRRHRYRESEKTYQKLRRIAPEEIGPHLQLGWLLARRGQVTSAISCFEQALQVMPGHPTAVNWLRKLRRDPRSYSGPRLKGRNVELREDADVVPLLAHMPTSIEEHLDAARRPDEPPVAWESARSFDAVEYRTYYDRAIAGQLPKERLAAFSRAAYLAVSGGSPEPAIAALINVALAYPWSAARASGRYRELWDYALAGIFLATRLSPPFADHCRRHLIQKIVGSPATLHGDRTHFLYALLLLGGEQEKTSMLAFLETRKAGDPWIQTLAEMLCADNEVTGHRVREWLQANWKETTRNAIARALVLDVDAATSQARLQALEIALAHRSDPDQRGVCPLTRLAALGESLTTLRSADTPPELAGALQGKVLGELVELPDSVRRHLPAGPMRRGMLYILRQVREIARASFGHGALDPELEVGIITKRLPLRETVELIVGIQNRGNGHAHDVQLRISKSPQFDILDGSTPIGILMPGAGAEVALRIRPLQEGDAPVSLQISCNNLDGEPIGRVLKEVISFYSAREFTRIASPYITGSPIHTPEMFYGRNETMEHVMERLAGVHQDNPLVIYGQRRTGKTSLLLQLQRGRIRRPYLPIYFDLQAFAGARTPRLVKVLMTTICNELDVAGIGLQPGADEWRALAETDPLGTFSDYLQAVGTQEGDFRLLLMLDEFEVLITSVRSDRVSPHLFDILRHVLQHNRRCSFIFTGADDLKALVSDYASILFNTAEFMDIGYLTRPEAVDLITQPLAGRIEYRREAIDGVIRATSCHPYYVQLVCSAVVDRMNSEMRTLVTEMDVAEAARGVAENETYFSHLWTACSEEQQLLVSLISALTDQEQPVLSLDEIWSWLLREGANRFDQADLTKTMSALVSKGILTEERVERERVFHVRTDLFRMYCSRFHPSHIIATVEEEEQK